MPRKSLISAIVIALLALAGTAFAYYVVMKTVEPTPIQVPPGQVYCTQEAKQCPDGSYVMRSGPKCEFATCPSTPPPPDQVNCTQEAKLCPDGSYVSRQGPKCEFAPCPSTPPGSTTCGPNQGSCQKGYTCIQRCGPPVVREGEPPPTWYCETDAIAAKPRMCPICLAKGTRIGSPGGDVLVQDLKIGDRVWSMDKDGTKIYSRVSAVTHTPVPKTHRVVHLDLADGRELWVSPDHPTSSGVRVGDLKVGEGYDGSRVAAAELVPYWSDATYDLLPDSETGLYWADGILMGSTLKGR